MPIDLRSNIEIEAGAPFIGWVFGWTLIIIAAGMIIATWIWI
jgi:hypothetical protein